MSRPLLLFVLGPTASGKSDLAVEIAVRSRSEIINCDSVQFFDGVDIGAAKPSHEQLTKVPHHLVGHVALGGEYTAGDFRRDAIKVIEPGAKNFLAVGGSGFYVQALEKGMYEVPKVPEVVRTKLEEEMEATGPAPLHAELTERDPEAAARIQVNDRYRVLRALEILRASNDGRTLSQMRAEFEAAREPAPFRVAKMGLSVSRERLRERVTIRTQKMLSLGLIEEVKALRERGFGNWGPLYSVGYKETQAYLEGSLSREELEPAIITATMQLAKRQMTWFKRDASIRWFDAEAEAERAIEFALAQLAT